MNTAREEGRGRLQTSPCREPSQGQLHFHFHFRQRGALRVRGVMRNVYGGCAGLLDPVSYGTQMAVLGCNGAANQNWLWSENGDLITEALGECTRRQGSGIDVSMRPCDNTPQALWQWRLFDVSVPRYQIVNQDSSRLCLRRPSFFDTALSTGDCRDRPDPIPPNLDDGLQAQLWEFNLIFE